MTEKLPSSSGPYIRGGGLAGRYNLGQFHLHWGGGTDSADGSEHLLNSRRFPAELHLVHFNAKYGTFAEAVNHKDGLAVLAFFIELSCRDNEAFEPIVQQLDQVAESGSKAVLSRSVLLRCLLPRDVSSFFRYQGSLTTPLCQEIVQWSVFENPISVSKRQVFFASFNSNSNIFL